MKTDGQSNELYESISFWKQNKIQINNAAMKQTV